MDRENRIIVGTVFVIFIAIISSNFGISGQIIRNSETEIKVAPDAVYVGQKVYIDIYPGSLGVNQKISFYQAEDNLRKDSTYIVCGVNFKCYDDTSFSYVIPTSWEPGIYFANVYDYGTKSYVKQEFTVRK